MYTRPANAKIIKLFEQLQEFRRIFTNQVQYIKSGKDNVHTTHTQAFKLFPPDLACTLLSVSQSYI